MYNDINNTMSQENNSNEIIAFQALQKSYTSSADFVTESLKKICTLGMGTKSKDAVPYDKANIDLGLANQKDDVQNEISTELKGTNQSPVANSEKERDEEITR